MLNSKKSKHSFKSITSDNTKYNNTETKVSAPSGLTLSSSQKRSQLRRNQALLCLSNILTELDLNLKLTSNLNSKEKEVLKVALKGILAELN